MGGMRILPVLDVLAGRVVRGIGGRRHEYRPVVSRLTSSCQPVEVARAFRDHFGFHEMYLADLDALSGSQPALDTYATIRALGIRLWVDAGLRTASRAAPLVEAGVERIVFGLETIAGPDVLAEACSRWDRECVVFSLDLRGGQPIGNLSAWEGPSPASIAAQAVAAGVRRLIVLDLARVGGGAGTGTEQLCAGLLAAHPDVEVIAGGGVRDAEDLRRLRRIGVHGVLAASALHDGQITPDGLRTP